MKYLLSVVHDEQGWEASEEEMKRAYRDVGAFNQELLAAGKMAFGGGLTPPNEAKTFDFKSATDVTVTDGPFAETKEYLGGFWVLEVESEEEAIELTRKATVAVQGKIELRPFQAGE